MTHHTLTDGASQARLDEVEESERLIEVKTTTQGKYFPFFLSPRTKCDAPRRWRDSTTCTLVPRRRVASLFELSILDQAALWQLVAETRLVVLLGQWLGVQLFPGT